MVLRWVHIVTGCLLGVVIYSPLGKQMPEASLITQICILPILVLSGLVLWNQTGLGRLLGIK